MSVGNLYFPNSNNVFCHDLTLSGDLNMDGDILLNDVIFDGAITQPEFYNAKGDGVSDDSAAIQSCIDNANGNKIYGAHKKYAITSVNNPLGVPFDNNLQLISGGQMVNSYCRDMTNLIWGKEHLGAFHTKLRTFANATVIMTGDSTTAGGFAFDYLDMPLQGITSTILGRLFGNDGFDNVEVINNATYGAKLNTWTDTTMAQDIAKNPDLYIIRWGINNMGFNTIPEYATAFRAAMTTMRAALPESTTSVVLMCTNSVTGSGETNTITCEEYNKIFRECANDFGCVFFDTYALMNKHADYMFKDIFHPTELYNNIMMSILYDAIIPDAVKLQYAFKQPTSKVINNTGVEIKQEGDCTLAVSGESLNPSWSKGRFYTHVSRTTGVGSITCDGTWIDIPILSRILFPLNEQIDNGGSFCIRCQYKPNFNATENSDLIIFDIGYGTGWIIPPAPYQSFRLLHAGGAGNLALQVSENGAYLLYDFAGAFAVVSGTTYEIEMDYNSVADTVDIFVNGVKNVATIAVPHIVRAPSNALSFGHQYMNQAGCEFFVNNIQFFNTVKHSANYTPSSSYLKITNENVYINTLKMYEETSINTTISGLWAAPLASTKVMLVKVGNVVTLKYITGRTGAVVGGLVITFDTPLPAGFYDTAGDCICPVWFVDNSTSKMGELYIHSNGTWEIQTASAPTGTSGTYPFNATFIVSH